MSGQYDILADKMDKDFRRGLEFVMRVRPFYTRQDLLRIDYRTFFALLEECEAEQREEVARQKEQAGKTKQ